MKEKMEPFPMARVLSSKENNETGETSFRVYYGATGAAVPFMWESQPGTPKHPIFDKNVNFVPPLTPPPSYCYRDDPCKKTRKHKIIFRAFVSSITFTRSRSSTTSRSTSHNVTPTSSSSSSWSTSSTSSTSSPRSPPRRKSHRRSFSFCSVREPLFGEDEAEEEQNARSIGSVMCFGFKKQQQARVRYSMQ